MLGSLYKRKHLRRGLLGHLVVWLRNFLLIAVVAVAAARFYTEYQLDRKLEQLAGMVAPVGTLTFGKSYTAFNGDIGIENLSFIPDPGLDIPPATLREGILHTPGYLWVLGLRGGQAFPPSMGATLDGLKMELTEFGGTNIERSAVSGNPLETLGCGDITQFQTIDLNKMGFGPMETSLSGRYRVLPPERIELQMVVGSADAAETHVDLELKVLNLMDFSLGRAQPVIELAELTVALHAAEFNRRRNEYCATEIDADSAVFVSNHVAEAQESLLAMGYTVNLGVLDQYQRFISGDGVWTFLGRPDRPLPLTELVGIAPLDLMDRLNVNAAIGSALPEQVVITQLYKVVGDEGATVAVEKPELTDDGRPVVRMSGGQKRFSWALVPLADSAAYVGQDVRIQTRFGKRYSGALTAVADGQIIVNTRLPGGQAQIPIPVTQIAELRVIRYETN